MRHRVVTKKETTLLFKINKAEQLENYSRLYINSKHLGKVLIKGITLIQFAAILAML